jgi:transposase-like protein
MSSPRTAKKELVGLTNGKELLLDLKHRGLELAPKLVVADGALGFWKAVGKVWSKVREQRCWVPKTANVLNNLPKRRPSSLLKSPEI